MITAAYASPAPQDGRVAAAVVGVSVQFEPVSHLPNPALPGERKQIAERVGRA